MMSLPKALALALAQLGDRAVLRVLGKSIALTLAIFVAAGFALWQCVDWAFARYAESWGGIASLVALLLTVIGAWVLFRIVALAVAQLFADEVVTAVEARHYPGRAPRQLGMAEELRAALGGAVRALAVNAMALPLALLLLVTGVGTAVLFFAVNAWLLGRELQDIVWLRHRSDRAATPPLGSMTRFGLGGAVAGLLLVPGLNFLAPILGAAAATHLVLGSRKDTNT